MPNRPFQPILMPLLNVRSIEETYRYYTNVLGFTPGMVMPGPDGKWAHAEVSLGGVILMFGRLDQATMDLSIAKTTFAENTKKGALGGGMNLYINLGTGSIDQYHRWIRERGAKTVTEPETKFWGDRMFVLQDPDGYLITFAETVADFDPSKMPTQ